MAIKTHIPGLPGEIQDLTVDGTLIVDGYTISPASAVNGASLTWNGSAYVPIVPIGNVISVSNSDGSVTVSPTTGNVVVSLPALGSAGSFTVGNGSITFDAYGRETAHTNATNVVLTSRNINTTSPITGGGDLSADRTIAIPQSSASVDGYLSKTDWSTFNSKVAGSGTLNQLAYFSAAGTIASSSNFAISGTKLTVAGHIGLDGYTIDLSAGAVTNQILQYNGTSFVAVTFTGTGTVTNVATQAPLTGGPITTSGTISIPKASGSVDGYLAQADWTTFNNKGSGTVTNVATDSTLTGGPITTTGTLGINLGNANTWTAAQTFNTAAVIFGHGATATGSTDFDLSGSSGTLKATSVTTNTINGTAVNSTISIGDNLTTGSVIIGKNMATNGGPIIIGGDSTTSGRKVEGDRWWLGTRNSGIPGFRMVLSSVSNTSPTTGDTRGNTGLLFYNDSGAANNAQQYSPSLELYGTGWSTGSSVSRVVGIAQQVIPVQGSTPTGALHWFSDINNTFLDIANLDSTGTFTALHHLGFDGYVLDASGGAVSGQNLQYNGTSFVPSTPVNQTITLSSDVTGSGTTAITTTIAAGVVTYAKIQNISAAGVLLGRKTAGAGSTEEITPAGDITLSGSTFTIANSAVTGVKIAASTIDPTTKLSSTGTPSSSTYLRGDNTWANISAGSGTVTSIVVSSPLTGGTITTTGTIAIPKADGTHDGYLAQGDWTTFNNKGSGSVTSIVFSSPLTGGTVTATGTVAIPKASGSQDGYLAQGDWTTFNNKGSGTVTSVSAGTGMSFTTITTTGSVAIDTTVVATTSNSLTMASKTLTAPVINGATSSGSTAIDFSGNSGAFKTSTGASTFGGSSNSFTNAVTIAATTNQLVLGTTNTVTLTSPAPASSRTVTLPDLGANTRLVQNANNASETLLSTTGATDVISFTPAAAGNFMAMIYYRVVTGATNLTINVTYTDQTGAQTAIVVPAAQSQAINSYIMAPVFFNATAAVVKVTATAGTANQIYVSASVVGL